jgi:hypothetical protein
MISVKSRKKQDILLFSEIFRTTLEPTQPPIQRVPTFFPGVKVEEA